MLTRWLGIVGASGLLAVCLAAATAGRGAAQEEDWPSPDAEATATPEVSVTPSAEATTTPSPELPSITPLDLSTETEPTPVAPSVTPAASSLSESLEETARRRLGEAARAETETRASSQATSRYFTDIGRKLFEAERYQEALDYFNKALTFDRSNREAERGRKETLERLSEERTTIESAARRYENRSRVAIEQMLDELNTHYFRARAMVDEAINPPPSMTMLKTPEERLGDSIEMIDRAFVHIERAREIIKWAPYHVPLADYETRLNRLRREGEQAKQRFQEELNQIRVANAVRMAQTTKVVAKEIERKKLAQLIDALAITYDRKEYVQAQLLAEEVQRLDPSNYYAKEIKYRAAMREHTRKGTRVLELRHEEKERGWVRVALASRPWVRYLLFPPNWDEISKRGAFGRIETPPESWETKIRDALERRIDLTVVPARPLSEVIDYFTDLTQVSFVLGAGVGAQPVSLTVSDMKISQILRWLLAQTQPRLGFTVRDQAVFIGTQADLQGELKTEIYDVRDLVMAVNNFPAPNIAMGLGGPGGAPFGAGGVGAGAGIEPPRVIDQNALPALIRTRVSNDEWVAGSGTSIEARDGRLIVRQRPEVLRVIEKILDELRKAETIQILVEARFIEVRDSFLEDIGIDWTDLPVTDPQFASAAAVPYMYPGPAPAPPADPQSPYVNLIDPDHPMTPNMGTAPFIVGISNRMDSDYLIPIPPTGGPTDPPAGRVDNNPFGTLVGGDLFPGIYDWRLWAVNQNRRQLPFGTRLGISTPIGSGQGANFAFRFLGNIQAQAILHAVARDEKSDVLLAPRVTMFNNQRAFVAVTTQQPYIAGYQAVGGGAAPQMATMMLGVVLDVQPVVSHDLRYVTMNLRPSTARLINVLDMDVAGTSTGVGGAAAAVAYVVQLPTIEIRSVATTVTMPDGGTILLSGLMNEMSFHSDSGVPLIADIPIIGVIASSRLKQREKRNLLILVSTHIILLQEEERNRRNTAGSGVGAAGVEVR